MAGDGESAHIITPSRQRTSGVKVMERWLDLGRIPVHPILIGENWRCRRLLDIRLAIEVPGLIGRLPTRLVGVEPAIQTIAAKEVGLAVRSPAHPRLVSRPLAIAASGDWLAQWSAGAGADAFLAGRDVKRTHPRTAAGKAWIVIARVFAVIVDVHQTNHTQLFDIADALNPQGAQLRGGQHRQYERDQDANDRDDDQQFNQREAGFSKMMSGNAHGLASMFNG